MTMGELLMPKLGLTMTEGLLSEWHVAPGQCFSAGDILFTVETEKVANEVEAEADGVLAELLVAAGDTVAVGTAVAQLAGGDTAASASAKAEQIAPQTLTRAQAPAVKFATAAEDRIIATPLARRIAANEGISLKGLIGSGPRGRIKAGDVKQAFSTSPTIAGPQTMERETAPGAIRLATARLVTKAKAEIPHFYVSHEAELTRLEQLRDDLNGSGFATRISVTHMLIRAIGLALAERPDMNRIWVSDKIIAFDKVDIGMVAETPDGLRIPVIRDAGGGTLDYIAAQANDLAARARDGKLTPAEVGDGVISVSNVGMFGVTSLTPIINPPNAMIMGVGATRDLFRPGSDGTPQLCRELTLTLACDHRIIDGADAARLLAAIVDILENPLRLMRPVRANA